MNLRLIGLTVLIPLVGMTSSAAFSEDWPQWRGVNRDAVWDETGIVTEISDSGLKVNWRTPIAGGYAGPAVVGDRVYVTDFIRESGDPTNGPGTVNELAGTERVLCLDASNGEIIWTNARECKYRISYPCGPRTTPTVDGDRVVTLGAEGTLLCLNRHNGEVLWEKNFPEEYQAKTPIWGFSSHPLIDGNMVYCVVGGPGSIAVAFDLETGEEKWRALTASEQGYCPPTLIEAGGRKQLLIWDADNLNGLDPETGEVFWSVALKPSYGMSIMAPQVSGNLLFASGIGDVGVLLKLNEETPTVTELWRGHPRNSVYCANSTPFIDGQTLFGVDCKTGGLRGVDLETGERLWETFEPTTGSHRMGHGTAFLIKNGSRYLLFSETGDLILANLTREGYEEVGRFHVLEPTGEAFGRNVVWTHPAFANGQCYVRNDEEIVSVSLRADEQ
ncbi:PQQ-binding-like beta-propeller repeat protein [Thalassoglobus sp. JC818]|uniref:PQQ-binding-like beta-propeller repeat protein n=1 Tax=Thalassoglobus sp. JC818 TaxID=3232136 RepID=UPI00345803C9